VRVGKRARREKKDLLIREAAFEAGQAGVHEFQDELLPLALIILLWHH
jgi:hypothetical protein